MDKTKSNFKILVINPGSVTTKIAVFDNDKPVFEETIHHDPEQLKHFRKVLDQYNFRRKVILERLKEREINLNTLNCIVARGGLLAPVKSGTYKINEKMLRDSKAAKRGEHASNLGAFLAYNIAKTLNVPNFIVDPVSVDELEPIARLSGTSLFERESLLHALNVKAVARATAIKLKQRLQDINLVVAHLGGGITVSAIKKGKVIDVANGLTEGPFTPERAGSLPTLPLVNVCFSGKYKKEEIKKMLLGKGGLIAYLGTNDAVKIEKMIKEGNKKAELVFKAMAYQIAKEIGAYSAVLEGKVDRIILTGGLAKSKMLVSEISKYIKFIAPLELVPGGHEMEALALGALRVLKGEESAKVYG